ncbi:MAG: hypothetical protein V4690_03460 [Patescibacteria group bacterium]
MNYKISIITPEYKNDYLTDTIIDGCILLKTENPGFEFKVPKGYLSGFDDTEFSLDEGLFVEYAKNSDLILFCWGKDNTNYKLAETINEFNKTVFVDGGEIGKNGRYDTGIQKAIVDGSYLNRGKIDKEMERKCVLYFRREKPYVRNILPLPFGIESDYTKFYSVDIKKDVDFFCVFGQDEYPILRREVTQVLKNFCVENNFTCFTDKTDQENFYKNLARSKVGISVGGGGFDTARFWEILGNNCMLLTETIDIYEPGSNRLDYKRIWQFKDLEDFKLKLEEVGQFLVNSYKQTDLAPEYSKILEEHSSKARVLEVIEKAREKGIIQ